MVKKLIYGARAVLLALVFTACKEPSNDDTWETELSKIVGQWDKKNTSPSVPAFEITSDGKFIMEETRYDISVSDGAATIKFGGTILGTFNYGVNNNEMVMIDGTGIGTNIAAFSPVVKRYTLQNPFPLTENQWADGNLPASSDEQWFTFTAASSTQYIHVGFGTLTRLSVQVYDSGGAAVGSEAELYGSTKYTSRSLTAGQTYYIKLRSYSNYSGTYRIAFNTTIYLPDAASIQTLTENQWADGSLPTGSSQQWFTFTATAAAQYIHVSFGTLTDLYVQAYDSSGAAVGSAANLYGSTRYASRSLTSGQTYYIKVTPYGSSDSGTYRIGFNTSSTAPATKTLTGITLNTATVKKDYILNETLNLTGLVVTANYSDSTGAMITNYTASPVQDTALTAAGNDIKVTISYTEDGVTKTADFYVTVTSGGGQGTAPSITTTALTGGTVGTAYSQALTATGDAPITWNIESGSLPAGLTLSGNTISGTPAAANTFYFIVKAANAAGDDSKALSIVIAPGTNPGGGSTNIEMVYVPGGSFQMGNPDTSVGDSDERPVRTVTLSGFYIGKYEVTQAQWQVVMGTNPSSGYGVGNNYPVYYVSWYDALVFCNKLSMAQGLTPAYRINNSTNPDDWGAVPTSDNAAWNAVEVVSGSTGYRLPTEAQWEYAAKGGNGSPGNYTYAGSNNVGDVAWYSGNSGSRTHEVGTKAPNGLGIYDMSGNVWEWCWDWYGSYSSGAQTDPAGASSGFNRVVRGGDWLNSAEYCSSANRVTATPNLRGNTLGFRLVRPVSTPAKTLTGITLNTGAVKKDYVQNETLNLSGLIITANYSDSTGATVTYTSSSPADGAALSSTGQITVTVSYIEGGVTKTASFIVNVTAATPAKTFTGITLNTATVKKDYIQNETLNLSGLIITANYSDSTSAAVTNYTANPANDTELTTAGTVTVTISYTEGGVTKTAEFYVNVSAVTTNKTLTGITLNTANVKKDYIQNETLNLAGLVVTANYSDSTGATVTYTSSSPADGAALSSTGNDIKVTISYTEGGVTRTADFTVTVTASYTVTFSADDGTPSPAQQNINHGGKINEPAAMTKEGYTFGGWFKEPALTNQWNFASDTLTQTITLYAKWTLNSYTVTFSADSGTPSPAQQNINHGGKVDEPPAMTRNGYAFGGWFKEPALTNQWNFASDTVTQTITLYAKWNQLSGTINVTFTGPAERIIGITRTITNNFSKSAGGSVSITINESFDRYEWYVGAVNLASGKSVTLQAANPVFIPGHNWVTVVVYTGTGANAIPWSGEFTVIAAE